MMTTWAEVVEPSTRALLDDDSDEEYVLNQDGTKTNIELIGVDMDTIPDISVFIIAHRKLTTSFVRRFIIEKNHALIAQVQDKNDKRVKTSTIHRIDEDVYLCCCDDVDLHDSNKFRNALLPFLEKSSKVVIVTEQSSYFSIDQQIIDMSSPFVRCLHTRSYDKSTDEIPSLEQPNFVTGLPAAVLSWCEVFGKPCILYCCYSSTTNLNSITAVPFISVFSTFPQSVFDAQKVVFQRERYHPDDSNMYM